MTDPAEILDACSHGRCYGHGYGCDITPCRPCAEAAITAAVAEERRETIELVDEFLAEVQRLASTLRAKLKGERR